MTQNKYMYSLVTAEAQERYEFLLYYQPKVNLETGAVVGMEALIRRHRRGAQAASPQRLMPMPGQADFIAPLEEWILDTSCRQNKAWQEVDMPALSISVNISAEHFHRENFSETVRHILDSSGLAPEFLELEISESVFMGHADSAVDTMHELNEMGVRLTIDDFGLSYFSLSYLRRLPIHSLKIDRSFVGNIPQDNCHRAIAAAIMALAHKLGIKVVAEGVDTLEQLDYLRSHGCCEMQGHLFCRPLPGEEAFYVLREAKRLSARRRRAGQPQAF